MPNNGKKIITSININIHFSGPGVSVLPPAQADRGSSDDDEGSPDNGGDPDGNRILLRAILGKVEDIQQQNEVLNEKLNFWKRMN